MGIYVSRVTLAWPLWWVEGSRSCVRRFRHWAGRRMSHFGSQAMYTVWTCYFIGIPLSMSLIRILLFIALFALVPFCASTFDQLKNETENFSSVSAIDSNTTLDSTESPQTTVEVVPKSCKEVSITNAKKRTETGGIFDIYVEEIGKEIEVFCDLTAFEGGWTVFQRRMDGSENFYRGWDDYVNGFGQKDKEFWLGLEYLHQMTKNGRYELRVELEDFKGNTVYSAHSEFNIGSSAQNYRLHVRWYIGDAGNSLGYSDKRSFTTKDKDNDGRIGVNCADLYHGGWWYDPWCGFSNLNGRYHNAIGFGLEGVWWWGWKSSVEYLKFTEMKFRRLY